MKKNCNIVKDLLPSYAYNITNEESNKFIEEHLNECEECRRMLENIKNDEKIVEEKKSNKYIDFAKKYKNKLSIMRIIILLFLIILMVVIFIPFTRKLYIISSLANSAKKYENVSNMHIIKYSYNQNSYIKNELWQMDNYKKMVVTTFNDGEVSKVEIYATKSENGYLLNCYSEVDEETTTNQIVTEEFLGIYIENIFDEKNCGQILKNAMFATIKNTMFDGKECYYLLNFDRGNEVLSDGVYIDKETGLIINEISYKYDDEFYPATSYIYEFGTVTEDDVIEQK